MTRHIKSVQRELENMEAFRPNIDGKCVVCGASPTVTASDLCGPCTWGESTTRDGGWWAPEEEGRYQTVLAEFQRAKQDRNSQQIGDVVRKMKFGRK